MAKTGISIEDKLQALLRLQAYRDDYKAMITDQGESYPFPMSGSPQAPLRRLTASAIRLCRKWGIAYPIDPDENLWRADPGSSSERRKAALAIKPVTYLSVPETWGSYQPESLSGKPEDGYIRSIDGRITVMIDPMFSEEAISEALEYIILESIERPDTAKRGLDSRVQETRGPEGKFKINIWKAYDAYLENGKKYLPTARSLYGVSGQPALDSDADKARKSVESAVKKAKGILEDIKKAAEAIDN